MHPDNSTKYIILCCIEVTTWSSVNNGRSWIWGVNYLCIYSAIYLFTLLCNYCWCNGQKSNISNESSFSCLFTCCIWLYGLFIITWATHFMRIYSIIPYQSFFSTRCSLSCKHSSLMMFPYSAKCNLLIKMAGWTEKHEDGVKRLPSRAYLNITEPLWQAEELRTQSRFPPLSYLITRGFSSKWIAVSFSFR